MGAFPSIKSCLSLLAALFLNLPCVVSVEIDHSSAGEAILLVYHVPEVDRRVGLHSVRDNISTVVKAMDGVRPQVVSSSLTRLLPFIDAFCSGAEEDIHRDLRFVIDEVIALRDEVFDVDVGGSRAINEEALAFPVVGREHCGDGGGAEGSLCHVCDCGVRLVKPVEGAIVDINCADSDSALELAVGGYHFL